MTETVKLEYDIMRIATDMGNYEINSFGKIYVDSAFLRDGYAMEPDEVRELGLELIAVAEFFKGQHEDKITEMEVEINEQTDDHREPDAGS